MNVLNLFMFYSLLNRPIGILIRLYDREVGEYVVLIKDIDHRTDIVSFAVKTWTPWLKYADTTPRETREKWLPYGMPPGTEFTMKFPDDGDYDLLAEGLYDETRIWFHLAEEHAIMFHFLDDELHDDNEDVICGERDQMADTEGENAVT